MTTITANTSPPTAPGAHLGDIDFWQFDRPQDYAEAMFEAVEVAALLGQKVVFAIGEEDKLDATVESSS